MAHLFGILEDDRSMNGLDSLGFDREITIRLLRTTADQVLENHAKASGKARWIDKTPRYVHHLRSLEEVYPDARFIVVYRHPLDQVHSYTKGGTKAWWDLEWDEDEPVQIAAARYWSHFSGELHQLVQRHRGSAIETRYESLMSHPEAEVKRLVDFLGETWEPAMLDYHRFDHALGFQDRRATISSNIRPATGGYNRWPAHLRTEVLRVTSAVRDVVGYSEQPFGQ